MNQAERKKACEALQEIEARLLEDTLRSYSEGQMQEFWRGIRSLNTFVDAKRKICG